MLDTNELADAGRRLSFALQPKLDPGADEGYRVLVGRYCGESAFRERVDALASGLGLEVIFASSAGVPSFFVEARRSSPFGYMLSNFKDERRLSETSRVKGRGLVALVTVALAAYVYPRAESLAESRYPIITASSLDRFVTDACAALKKQGNEEDARADDGEKEPAWRVYLNEPEMVPAKNGRRSPRGRLPLIQATLEFMSERGLLTRVQEGRRREETEATYQPHERLRQQILRGAPEEISGLFDTLSELRLAELKRR